MNRFILSLVFISCILSLAAQDPDGSYNPYVNQGTISPSPLLPAEVNGTGMISFNMGNTGSDPLDVYTDQYITLTITLSYGVPDNVNPVEAVSGTYAGYFSWSYDAPTFTAIQTSQIPASSSGTISIAYAVTQNSQSPGLNGFNINISPAPYQTSSNTTDDDFVSSYTYTEIRDYGDAPASYGSANHIMDFSRYLGSELDGEDADLASANADGDDLDGVDDEDGVVFPDEIHRNETITIPVTTSGTGYLNVWFDWNGDGDFSDAGEQVTDDIQRISGTEDLVITVPGNAIITLPTFARFRYSANSLASPTGSTTGGEVEDYQVTILCAPPEPVFTISDADSSYCEGTTVTFTAGGGDSYNFMIDGSSVQNSASITYTTSSLSDGQVVEVIVTDNIGCTAISDPITVTVFPMPEPTLVSTDGDNTICDGTTVTFTATGGTSYNFRLNGISVQDGSSAEYATSTLDDGDEVDVVVTNSDGCSATTPVIVNAVIPDPPVPDVTVTDNCDGTSTLTTSASGSLLWSTGEATPSISVTEPGTYTLTTTENGCISPEAQVNANPRLAPDAPAVSEAAPSNQCPDLTVDLTGLVTSSTPSGGSLLYKTTSDPLGTDVGDPSAAGAGTYYLFYLGSDGCYSPATEVEVTVVACPPDITPTVIVNPNIMHGVTDFNLVVRITELNQVNTNSSITVVIPKDARWILTDGFDQSLSILGSTPVNNSIWSYTEDVDNHIFTTASEIPAGGFINFGCLVTFDPSSTRGVYSITSQVQAGSGGEARSGNNADAESIDYFQQ